MTLIHSSNNRWLGHFSDVYFYVNDGHIFFTQKYVFPYVESLNITMNLLILFHII